MRSFLWDGPLLVFGGSYTLSPVSCIPHSHQTNKTKQKTPRFPGLADVSRAKAGFPHAYLPKFPVSICFWLLENFHFLFSLVIHLSKYFCYFVQRFKLCLWGGPFWCACEVKNGNLNRFLLINTLKSGFIGCDFCLVYSKVLFK